MAGTIPLGRFCWHELLTTDTDAAAAFYTKVVGWGLIPWEQDPSYRMWSADGVPIGGLMALPDDAKRMGAPPHWLWYGSTPNVDDTVAHAYRLGAKPLSGMIDVPNVGRMAVMSDPQGAVFAAYQPAGETSGHDGKPRVGEFSWHELATTDWKAAFDFYRALFGWEKTDVMDMGPGGMYLMFGRLGVTLGGIYNKPPEMPAPPHWLCYARVPDADKAAALATKLGGKILNGPMDPPGGDRIYQCMDPQGAAFAVHAVAVAAVVAARPAKRAAKPKAAPAKKTTKKKTKSAKKKTARKQAKRKPARRAAKTRKPLRSKKKPAKRTARRKGRLR
ncbi:MAG: VOC family protein [Gemmatimonadales bacterium]|nr:VOC family protein [Gemmatimonadales bacterium]